MAIAAVGTTGITPKGPAIDVWLNLVHVASIFLATPTRGHHGTHYYYEQDKFRKKIFWSPSGAKDPRNISARMFHSTKHKTMLFIYKKNAQHGGEVYASSGSRSNRSTMVRATSSTPTLAASVGSSMSSREMLGS
jgi:hypothetical protein